jgi:hypothetical protein
MWRVTRRGPFAPGLAAACAFALLSAVLHAQTESAVYLFVADAENRPVLDIEPSNITIKEDLGVSTVVRVTRAGWPLRLTVLVDNGPGTAESLVHLRTGLTRLFDGIPRDIPVTLITTAPNPRVLIRDSKDAVQLANAVGRLTPDEGLGRFSDALREYAQRLDLEFQRVGPELLQPYLPVLVSIATTHMDGSNVVRENIERMLQSLRKHRVWTHMIMVTPNRRANTPGVVDNVDADEGQNAEIARLVREVTGGAYLPMTGGGTSALGSKVMPDMAAAIALRYLKQMFQHRIVFQRPEGASGPMKNFSLGLKNHPGARILVSTDGNMP